jgi:hypothetical protein
MSEWQFFNKNAVDGTPEAALHLCAGFTELRMRLASYQQKHRCRADSLSVRVPPDATDRQVQEIRAAGYWIDNR